MYSRVIIAVNACVVLQLSAQAAPTSVAASIPGTKPVDVSVVSKDELAMVATQADKLLHDVKKLSGEFNRHEEIQRWNGMFGGMDNSLSDIGPIGGGLCTDVDQGPLMPARPEIVDDLTDKITNDMNACLDLIRQATLQGTADDTVKAQWKVAVDTAMALRQDCQKLDDMCVGPPYDQPEVTKLLNKFESDAYGLNKMIKRLHDMVKKGSN